MTTTTMTMQSTIVVPDTTNNKDRGLQYRDSYAQWLERECRQLPVQLYRGANKQGNDVVHLVFSVPVLKDLYRDESKLADYLVWLALGDAPDTQLTKVILEVDLSECCRLMATNHKVVKMWQDRLHEIQADKWFNGLNEQDINNWIFANPEPLWIEKIDVLCPKTVSLTEAQY